MNGKEIRVAELFAGIGGFRLGLEQANNSIEAIQKSENSRSNLPHIETGNGNKWNQHAFSVVWANEWDKHASAIYRKNFGEKELAEGGIGKIEANEIPDHDLLVGGFPCQAFSIAGKRQGFKDIRGTMFFQIARIAKAKRPKILLLENVKGLLNHDNGGTFETIVRTLDELGYDVEWQVFNSKYHGVPQNRERVFIIGHLRGSSTGQIFPISTTSNQSYKRDSGEQIANSLQSPGHASGNYRGMNMVYWASSQEGWQNRDISEASPTLKGQNDLCRQPLIVQQHSHSGPDGKGRGVRTFEGVCPTLAGQMGTGGNNVPMVAQALQTDGFLRQGSSFGTDKPQSSRNIRRLTPTECERLQGFPDGWTQGVSDTQRYKTLGNAVTVNVIQFLGERILEVCDS